jgi:hypothetical protein
MAEFNTINQMDTTLSASEHTFFSSSHETFTKTEYILDHKTHLNKFRRIEIMQYLLSANSEIKLEINTRMINRKSQNTWRLNNILLHITYIKEETLREIFKYFQIKMEV